MIMGVVKTVLEFFQPPDPPMTDFFGPEASLAKIERHMKAMQVWRTKVTYTLAFGAALVTIALFTPWGFIRAGDLQKQVDASVKDSVLAVSVEEIKKEQLRSKAEQTAMKVELSEVKSQLDVMTPVIKEIYKAATSATICRLLASKLRAEADSEQTKYKAMSGEFYPESRCGGK